MGKIDEKIIHKLKILICLLDNNDEPRWAVVFKHVLVEFMQANDKKIIAAYIIELYMGGMGSFADLILQKPEQKLILENDQLEELKTELYSLCKKKLIE